MGAYMLQDQPDIRELVNMAHRSGEPLIVFDGDDECLVAMRPSVFERILFDSDLLNCEDRSTMHL